MQGENVFSFTISEVPRTVKEFLAKTETSVEDYDCFAFHQANRFILQMIAKKLKVDISKFPICMDRYGNTSGPSVPITICDCYGTEDSEQEVNIMMSSYGVGLSWGVCSATVNMKDIYPIIETDEIFTEGIINCPEDFLRDE
jgi:3-oxoacyl-[acyl-carrier-protein] synthase-3